jgi:hypothetical protein
MNDKKFSALVEDMFNVEDTVADDDDDNDSGYFSNGELSSSQEIEVEDDFFIEHIMDEDEDEHVAAHNPSSFATLKPTERVDAIGDGPPFSQDSSCAILDNYGPSTLGSKWKELSIADALAWKPRHDDVHQIVMCCLKCDDCHVQGTMLVFIGNEEFDNHYCSTEQWLLLSYRSRSIYI